MPFRQLSIRGDSRSLLMFAGSQWLSLLLILIRLLEFADDSGFCYTLAEIVQKFCRFQLVLHREIEIMSVL